MAGYLIEAGVLIVLAPWTRLWEHNLFVSWSPAATDFVSSLFVRGAVSGVGLVTIVGGLRDLASVLFAKRDGYDQQGPASHLPGH